MNIASPKEKKRYCFYHLLKDLVRFDIGNIIQGRDLFCNNLRTTITLDIFQLIKLTTGDKCESFAILAGTACSSDSMHIIFIILRQIIVENIPGLLCKRNYFYRGIRTKLLAWPDLTEYFRCTASLGECSRRKH